MYSFGCTEIRICLDLSTNNLGDKGAIELANMFKSYDNITKCNQSEPWKKYTDKFIYNHITSEFNEYLVAHL